MHAQARRRRAGIRPARALLSLGLLVAGLVLSAAFVGLAVRQTAVDDERRTYEAQIDAELARRAQLDAEVQRRSGDDYVVDKARGLGYVRPGEGLIAVEGRNDAAVATAGVPDGGRLARWLALFFGPR